MIKTLGTILSFIELVSVLQLLEEPAHKGRKVLILKGNMLAESSPVSGRLEARLHLGRIIHVYVKLHRLTHLWHRSVMLTALISVINFHLFHLVKIPLYQSPL